MNTDLALRHEQNEPRASSQQREASSQTYFFVITPHATLGPPLTPDFGSPVMP